MALNDNVLDKILLFLFCIIPISIIAGPAVSLLNIIFLSILSVYFYLKNINDYKFFKNQYLILIIILFIYLLFNLIISQDYKLSLARNLGFLRYIFLIFIFNYFFYENEKVKEIFKFWTIVFLIFLIDVYIEYFFGSNLFGWGAKEINGVTQIHADRIMSFFKDEPIAGAFLSGFAFLIFGYLMEYNQNKFIALAFIVTLIVAIMLTGERSNLIKTLISSFIFLILINKIDYKQKILVLLTIAALLSITFKYSDYIKNRYFYILEINSKEKITELTKENIYFKIYRSGLSVFKNYPLFGVGNKNYRLVTCENEFKKFNKNYICQTHPHQIYIELLSEHGLVGAVIILGILFYIFFKILFQIYLSQNYIQLGAFSFLISNFIPLLPSGAFFGDFNSNIFWINFSILIASSKETNIFNLKR